MIFWFVLLMGLIVCISIAVAVFSLSFPLFRNIPDQEVCGDDDIVVVDSENSLAESTGNVSSLLVKQEEKEEEQEACAALPASSTRIWLPPDLQSEPVVPSRKAVYPSISSRSPYASVFHQKQEDLAVTEFNGLVSYKCGVDMYYDAKIEAFRIVFTGFTFKSTQDIELYCRMIDEDTEAVLKERGREKAGILVDLSGLNVAGDITTIWGDGVNKHTDAFCRKFASGDYHYASYFSTPIKDDQEYIKRKKMEVLMKTEAARHNFQCNLFASKEEAIAYYRYLSTMNC